MTLAEWAEMDEDEPGELVDGQIVPEEEMGAEHDVVGAWLIWVLRSWLAPRGGIIGMSDTRFGVSRTRGRKPDTYVYLRGDYLRRDSSSTLQALSPFTGSLDDIRVTVGLSHRL